MRALKGVGAADQTPPANAEAFFMG